MRAEFAVPVLLFCLIAACGDDSKESPAPDTAASEDTAAELDTPPDEDLAEPDQGPYPGYHSETYADLPSWLCHPDAEGDACDADLDETVVAADGTTEVRPHIRAEGPPVDCFFVYPTISLDKTPNSDMDPGPEEKFIAYNQAARYSAYCRVFAPVYRQVTIGSLVGQNPDADRELATADVVDAFKHFIANHAQGRPYLLVGHSQGAGKLRELIVAEIEGDEWLESRLVAAHLIGTAIEVPNGALTGGAFTTLPLCQSQDEAGCVLTWGSYRKTVPPTAEFGVFGKTADPNTFAGCTNPAALTGGETPIRSSFPAKVIPELTAFLGGSAASPWADPENPPTEITTGFFTTPGLLTGECVKDGDFDYLEVSIHADESDPRRDDLAGDLAKGWGLHLVDMHLVMGDLMEMTGRQIDAWLAR